MTLQTEVTDAYQKLFGEPPTIVVRAPGRVNLIGEHTDYNGGFVMPLAIDRYSVIALGPRTDEHVHIHSLHHDEFADINLKNLKKDSSTWREYIKGMAWALIEAGYDLKGWQGVTGTDIPMGAGLSSSASIEMAVARAFQVVSGFEWDAPKMALLGQRAENEWVGVNCGIMDQMISATGQKGRAILIDCRSLEFWPVPLPKGTLPVIMDTSTRRGLMDSAYNERRRQCEEAAHFFGVDLLRDVSVETFEKRQQELPDLTRRRARHVITEIARTLEAAEAMKAGDAEELGRLMDASHDSLRDDFEVSNDALNTIVDIARRTKGCLGARMTGAGFGGCGVALVHEEDVPLFVANVATDYQQATEMTPSIYVCTPSNGAEVLVS